MFYTFNWITNLPGHPSTNISGKLLRLSGICLIVLGGVIVCLRLTTSTTVGEHKVYNSVSLTYVYIL